MNRLYKNLIYIQNKANRLFKQSIYPTKNRLTKQYKNKNKINVPIFANSRRTYSSDNKKGSYSHLLLSLHSIIAAGFTLLMSYDYIWDQETTLIFLMFPVIFTIMFFCYPFIILDKIIFKKKLE